MRPLMLCLTLFSLFQQQLWAQTTLQEAEEYFRANNLQLLAAKYDITAAQAAVIQAKIWEQPYLSGELNALNPSQKQVFSIGSQGQKGIAIQQLIYLGGKKQREISFAKSTVLLAELQFEELLLSLRYRLRQQFYGLYFNGLKMESILGQVSRVDTLIQAYTVQVTKNNLSLKDLVRLQSLALDLHQELSTIKQEVIAQQNELSLLTGSSQPVVPVIDSTTLKGQYEKDLGLELGQLLQLAQENSPTYRSYQQLKENQSLFLKWQEAMAKPDLTAGLAYDQRGGAFNNQMNITVGIPIPLWNRNKGNIKIAQAQLAQSGIQTEFKTLELKSQLQTGYDTWETYQKQYHQFAQTTENLEQIYQSVIQNFQKRNIGILEFTDFMESYNQSMLHLYEMRKLLILAQDNINHLVNTIVF